MGIFKRTTTTNGSYKELVVENGSFVDPESGEEVDVARQLERIYGTQVFSLKTAAKQDEDIEA